VITNEHAREVAALVQMPRLLESLGFRVDARSHRAVCILHGGSNRSAFSWRDDGVWHCFSCGRGGDRIALVREARGCGFREAVEFLAQLAGVTSLPHCVSRGEVARARRRCERASAAAWTIYDTISRLRVYYTDALHRCERLWARVGEELRSASSDAERKAAWDRLQHLAPSCTFCFAAFDFINRADAFALTRFALTTPDHRRAIILEENDGNHKTEAP